MNLADKTFGCLISLDVVGISCIMCYGHQSFSVEVEIRQPDYQLHLEFLHSPIGLFSNLLLPFALLQALMNLCNMWNKTLICSV